MRCRRKRCLGGAAANLQGKAKARTDRAFVCDLRCTLHLLDAIKRFFVQCEWGPHSDLVGRP